jgi:glycosyltransferase involved in cell wall biosynthesis
MEESGHEVVVFAVDGTRLAEQATGRWGRYEGFPRQPRYAAGPAARGMATRLKRLGVEALWVRDPRDLTFAGKATQRAGIPFIFQQGMQFSRSKHTPWHTFRFNRVTRWVSPAHWLAAQAAALTPLRSDQIYTIPLALDDPWFTAPWDPFARTAWGWPESARVVGLFGRFDPLKGQADFLRALALVPGIHGWLIGESTVNEGRPYETQLKALAAELGIADRVRFDPPTESLRSAFDAVDAFAMCSVSETFGMVTLEALSRGVFVVGTRSGGTPELLEGHSGTALYEPGNVAELASILKEIHGGRFHRNLDLHKKAHAVAAWNELLAALHVER